jgi:hypothetical protein
MFPGAAIRHAFRSSSAWETSIVIVFLLDWVTSISGTYVFVVVVVVTGIDTGRALSILGFIIIPGRE